MRNFDRLSHRRATLPQAINATLQKMKLFAIALSFGAALAADAAEKARLQAALPPAEKVAVVAADPAAKAAATAAPMEATMCTNFCVHSRDGDCDDGGPGSEYSLCSPGTDCADCGRCSNTCAHRYDGDCDDGGFGSEYGRKPRHSPATSRRPARPRLSACNWRGSVCTMGSDCGDCGRRGSFFLQSETAATPAQPHLAHAGSGVGLAAAFGLAAVALAGVVVARSRRGATPDQAPEAPML